MVVLGIEKKSCSYLLLLFTIVMSSIFIFSWGYEKVEVQLVRLGIIFIGIVLYNKGFLLGKALLILFSFFCAIINLALAYSVDGALFWQGLFLLAGIVYLLFTYRLLKVED